ncbi:hypothetical protein, partial [Bacillus cereus group sp. BC306]|uniref:hypothetical protein n=1 Tax=Bacillus cereus group sp. BC306 TaxID=3445320 RepID=UPI003F1E8BB7
AAAACGALLSLAACSGSHDAPSDANLALGTPVPVESPAMDSAALTRSTPHLTLDTSGGVWLSWTERLTDSTVRVRVARHDGSRWDSA